MKDLEMKRIETEFKGRSFEWLQGYHAAMTEVAKHAFDITRAQQRIQLDAPLSFFGRQTPMHYLAAGGICISKRLSDFAFEHGTAAFNARRNSQ